MTEHRTFGSRIGAAEQRIPPTPRPASTLYPPSVQSNEPDSSGPSRTIHDEVVQDLAPPAGVSPTSPSSNAALRAAAGVVNSSEAPVMAEQSGRSNTEARHLNIQIADSNTPQVAQNAAARQGQSRNDQHRERERTTSKSPISPSSPPAGDGNETDETEYCDEGVGLDGTDEGVDIDLLLQRVADDEARKRMRDHE